MKQSSVRCLVTRMRMKRPWHVAAAYRMHRRMRQAAQRKCVPGLLKVAFFVEDRHTCVSYSMWDRDPAFSTFVPEHIRAVNRVFSMLAHDERGRPELSSTTWRLDALTNHHQWDDLDFVSLVGWEHLYVVGGKQCQVALAGESAEREGAG